MPKIRIKYNLKSLDNNINKEIIGIKKDNSIIFKDDDVLTSIKTLNDNIVMQRENDNFLLNLSLGKISKCTYLLKENNKELDINVTLKEKIISNNQIYFKYNNEIDTIEFELIYEVI